jgi:hypothetical protein
MLFSDPPACQNVCFFLNFYGFLLVFFPLRLAGAILLISAPWFLKYTYLIFSLKQTIKKTSTGQAY